MSLYFQGRRSLIIDRVGDIENRFVPGSGTNWVPPAIRRQLQRRASKPQTCCPPPSTPAPTNKADSSRYYTTRSPPPTLPEGAT